MFKKTTLTAMAASALLLLSSAPASFSAAANSQHYSARALFDPSYELFYDEYVYGALPIRITRTADDGPKRITLRIYAGTDPTPYYEYIDIEGLETSTVLTQYSGPYAVGVTIVEINPL